MTKTHSASLHRAAGAALALSLGLGLAGCGGVPTNASLYSVHQPVVERDNFTLDVATNADGLSPTEQRRLADWFDAMKLRYGDRIAIDDPVASPATRADVAAIAGRYGLLLSEDAPTTPGYVAMGNARIVITRSKASVPGCPDWSAKNDFNPNNATSSNFGCAINSNFAAMVANPEHLLKGEAGRGDTTIMSSNKAIDVYREAEPTGRAGLKDTSSKGN